MPRHDIFADASAMPACHYAFMMIFAIDDYATLLFRRHAAYYIYYDAALYAITPQICR